jgi:methanogenic corrinoid protein MtbC1
VADLKDSVEPFLEQAVHSDAASAVRHTLDFLDQGASVEEIVVDVLAAAQRESGDRWQKNHWGVADEHVVSGVTQRSLDAIANTVEPATPTGSVVVACAEGDWHSLPAQMFGEVLRSHGFAVSFLGASTPSDHVARLLARDRPDALVITCNLAMFFAGVTTVADAAHRTGTPVMAGGRALRSGPERARRLGADGWAPDVAAAVATLRAWAEVRPSLPKDPTPFDSVAMMLDLDSPQLASAAFDSMIASRPWMNGYNTEQLARTREDLAFIVRFIAAARLVEDPSVLMEFLDWLNSLLGARGVPTTALVAGLEALAPIVDQADPLAGLLIRDALCHVSGDDQGHKDDEGSR